MSDDTISRQAAIDALNDGAELLRRVLDDTDIVGTEREKYEWGLGLIESYIYDIEELPSAQPEQQWIPCNEVSVKGYPKENGFYYVTEQNYGFYLDADTRQKVAHTSPFQNGDFSDRYYDKNYSNIVAWMPLPEPYEAERE